VAARALWKGAISFGLIHIPVGLYTAVRANEIDLDLLDKRDFSPIGFQRYNKSTGDPVEWKNIVRGYQYEKGEYVVLNEEDFRRANVEATQTIDVHAFVDRDAIAPYHFETPYYLGPEKSGARVYALLRDALVKSGKLAVATVVIRTRQHLAALMPVDKVLLLNTLRYADEIQPAARALPEKDVKAQASSKELQMALRLIDEMSEQWKPSQYHDTYREDLMKAIEEKVRSGRTRTLTRPEASERAGQGGKVVDLMSLLKESLEERRKTDQKGNGAAKRESAAGGRSKYTRRRASRGRGSRQARRA
jgi:DNA end-binding protein Ku